MIELPQTTYLTNTTITKKKLLEHGRVNSKVRELLTVEVEKVTWTNKLSRETANLDEGEYTEMQVFNILLKADVEELSLLVLQMIDSIIPYPILFLITTSESEKENDNDSEESDGKESKGENKSKSSRTTAFLTYKTREGKVLVPDLYFSASLADITLELVGRSVDEVYTNFIYKLAPRLTKNIPLATAVLNYKQVQILNRKIERLTDKIRRTRSPREQQDFVHERLALEKERDQLIKL